MCCGKEMKLNQTFKRIAMFYLAIVVFLVQAFGDSIVIAIAALYILAALMHNLNVFYCIVILLMVVIGLIATLMWRDATTTEQHTNELDEKIQDIIDLLESLRA